MIKKQLPLTILNLIFILFIFKYDKVNAQENYRTMPFTHSPLHAMKGALKISDANDSIAIYSFKTENKKLKSIIYQLNGEPKPFYENYTSSAFVFASINEFEYRENEIIVRHFDHLLRPYKDKPAISKYKLDGKGRVIHLAYFDNDGNATELNGIHNYNWKYLKDKIGEVRYNNDGTIQPINSWFPYEWVLLEFDKDANLISIIETDENWNAKDDSVMIQFSIESNEITKWVAINTKTNQKTSNTGSGASETRHDYDSNGYLIRTRFFDTKGNRIRSKWGHMGFVRKYNNYGNRLSYNFIGMNDKKIVSARKYSGQKFVWDSKGRYRILTYYIDTEGEPMVRPAVGYSQIEYIYDTDGVEIGKVFKDIEGNIFCKENMKSFILLKNHDKKFQKINICS
ncbi:hypothetical protein [Flagellimonas marina]|uniref:YD repeat-containing protein n=1 Tax=Flagellimonas marina TaxID=1775168 RepID=A0ABV8PGY8_9FLAO